MINRKLEKARAAGAHYGAHVSHCSDLINYQGARYIVTRVELFEAPQIYIPRIGADGLAAPGGWLVADPDSRIARYTLRRIRGSALYHADHYASGHITAPRRAPAHEENRP